MGEREIPREREIPIEGEQKNSTGKKDMVRLKAEEWEREWENAAKAKLSTTSEQNYQITVGCIKDLLITLEKAEGTRQAEKRKGKSTEKEISMHKKTKHRNITDNNTLGLATEEYIKIAGEAETPKIFKRTDKWDEVLEAFLKKDKGTKALFLDFDGTMARFTDTPEQTLAVHGFLSAVKTFLDKGYKVAIITGRPIAGDKGILEVLKNSKASMELISSLDIFGSHGVEHRGHETAWKAQILAEVAEKIAPYAEMQEQLLNDLQQCIEANEKLKGLGISFEPKALGATIHYRAVEGSKRQEVKNELSELLSKVLPKASDNMNFSFLQNETYKNFTYNSATESYEIRLNPATTGAEVNKGTSVKSLAERWGVKDAIAFGDDTTDLDMQTRLQELVDDGASPLMTQAFVGVKHDKSPSEIMLGSTIVVEGQESAVGLLVQMAQKAEDQN